MLLRLMLFSVFKAVGKNVITNVYRMFSHHYVMCVCLSLSLYIFLSLSRHD